MSEVRSFTLEVDTHMSNEEILAKFSEGVRKLNKKVTFTVELDESMTEEEVIDFVEKVKRNSLAN